jgi:hypothetical protein
MWASLVCEKLYLIGSLIIGGMAADGGGAEVWGFWDGIVLLVEGQ